MRKRGNLFFGIQTVRSPLRFSNSFSRLLEQKRETANGRKSVNTTRRRAVVEEGACSRETYKVKVFATTKNIRKRATKLRTPNTYANILFMVRRHNN